MEQKTGMFVGLNKGFVVTKPKGGDAAFRKEKSFRKGRLHDRVKKVREVIAEICGLSPFERKMIELIKTGIVSKEKRAVKLARRKLGTQKRANAKRDQMNKFIMNQKRKQGEKA